MKLKSLLMGSAAALITVPAVHAADAVIAEPEPQDHVRVCDMYGAGFIYIPGTETCLKVSGELRVQYNYRTNDASDDSTGEGSWYGRVNFDVREETDYETLRAYIRMESKNGTNENTESDVYVRDAYIELGGMSVGYRTSRVELTGLPGQMFDGSYHGGGRTMYADYTYAANGLAVIGGISLDNAADGGESVDVYVRADYSGDMFSFGGVIGNDTSTEETAYGLYATITPMDGLTIGGYFNDQTGMTQFGSTDSEDDTRWGLGASFTVTDTVDVAAGYYSTENDSDETEGYSFNLAWTMVPNLVVQLGYNHEESDADEEDNYRVRIQRNF